MQTQAHLAILLTAASAAAQGTTWIVDAAGGAGSHFTDIPPAVAAAQDGDTVLVRAGPYRGFATSKALTVLGETTVTISLPVLPPSGTPVLQVTNLPRGKAFVLANVRVLASDSDKAAVALHNNQGRVHLDGVDARDGGLVGARAGLSVVDCAAVTITGGYLGGRPAASTFRGHVDLTGVAINGYSATISPRTNQRAAAGINATESTLHLARTDVRGGNGSLLYPQQAPALVSDLTTITITGDALTAIRAGTFAAGAPTAAVVANGATVLVDPLVQLIGSSGGAPIAGSSAVTIRRVAALRSQGAPLGDAVLVELTAPAGDPVQVEAGLPADPQVLPFGTLWLDLATAVPLYSGSQPAGGLWSRSLPVPNVAALRGLALALQAGRLDPARNRLELTNAAVVVIR